MNKYYKILGVQPGVSLATLKKAFRKKAMLLHPDVNSSPNAKQEFIQLKIAYEYLSSPRRRIPKPAKQTTNYKSKKKNYNRQAKKQAYYQKRRKPLKKEVEEISWSMLKKDFQRIGKAFLGGTSVIFILLFPFLWQGGLSASEIFYVFLMIVLAIGSFCLIAITFLLLSALPLLFNKKQ